MNTEAFVYKWINTENNKIYIGKHKGTPDDGYISSGKAFLASYWENPSIFKREILFYGSDSDCLKQEVILIKEAIDSLGYKQIYNLTYGHSINEWKRTCLHCGSFVDPTNIEWSEAFALRHFENCEKLKPVVEKKKKITREEFLLERSKLKKPEKKQRLTRLQQRKLWWKNKDAASSTQSS